MQHCYPSPIVIFHQNNPDRFYLAHLRVGSGVRQPAFLIPGQAPVLHLAPQNVPTTEFSP
jgi:hypothetical protein